MGKPSQYVASYIGDSAFHPSWVGKSSTSLAGVKVGTFNCVGWPLRQMASQSHSYEVGFLIKSHIYAPVTFNLWYITDAMNEDIKYRRLQSHCTVCFPHLRHEAGYYGPTI